MVDEVYEHAHAGKREDDTHGERDVGHEDVPAVAPNSAQHEKTVDEGGEKRSQYKLISAVSEKVPQQTGPELLRSR